MRLIDADAFDKCLEGAEIEATKRQKYVFSSAINTVRGNLENFPTINQWISCSEKLPQKSGNYIVTERRYSVDDRKHEGKYQTIVEEVRFTGEKWERAKFFDIIAWMPLPEPWKGEEE